MILWFNSWNDFERVCPNVLPIDADCFPDQVWDPLTWEGLFKNRELYVGSAIEKNVPTGFLAYTTTLDEAEILKIGVSKDRRKTGVGKSLLADGMAKARSQRIKMVHLEVRLQNNPAIHLYESAGFNKVGSRKNYYHAPIDDAVLYSIALDQ